MDNLFLRATPETPEVDFRCDAGQLSLTGESYPENAPAFYTAILERIDAFARATRGRNLQVEVALTYFNSASTRMLLRLFLLLDACAQAGNSVHVRWVFDAEDDTMGEFADELRADCPHLRIESVALAA